MANETVIVPSARPARLRYLDWSPIVAGALVAGAISFVLLSFGAGVGLTAISPWPNSGMPAVALTIVGALWLLIVHVGAVSAGAYLAGRARATWVEGHADERRYRDGAQGLAVWALAVVFTGVVIASVGSATLRTGAQVGAFALGGAAGGAAALSGPRAADPRAMEMRPGSPADVATDLAFRRAPIEQAAPRPEAQPGMPPMVPPGFLPPGGPNTVMLERQEANRIFVSALRGGELATRDRAYLAQMVSQRTGLPQAESERRVDEAIAEAKKLETEARAAADKARKGAALAAFLMAASLLVSCVAAIGAATVGGRHRDEAVEARFFGSRLW